MHGFCRVKAIIGGWLGKLLIFVFCLYVEVVFLCCQVVNLVNCSPISKIVFIVIIIIIPYINI